MVQTLPLSSRREPTLPPPWLLPPASRALRKDTCAVEPPRSAVLCDGSPSKFQVGRMEPDGAGGTQAEGTAHMLGRPGWPALMEEQSEVSRAGPSGHPEK